MDPEELLDVARGWSFWEEPPPRTVPREVALPKALEPGIALVIQGVRRCGKSTLMQQLVGRFHLDARDCLFLNCEDPRLSSQLDWRTLDALVKAFRAARGRTARLTFFLDEIQAIPGWEKWLRAQLDTERRACFVVTGSNASLLGGELGAVLTGRHRTLELFPFSFAEYRALRKRGTVADYLREGGFPASLASAEGDALLRQYFEDIVERDVRERIGARSTRPLRQVAQMACEAAGSELSARRVASATGLAIDTANAYLDGCVGAYLLASVPFFAYSERKRAAYNRKFYPVDTALRRAVITPGPPDLGKSLECAVFLALRRRHRDIAYWRGMGEVDFVVQEGRRVIPIQVTLDAPQPRHERALESFYEAHPHADEARTVTLANFAVFSATEL
jgi:predicted AAA+ superfamily ATPase